MCTEDVYTDIYADGRRVEHVRPTFCSRSRYGQLCDSPVVYKHPSRVMQAGDQPAKFLYPTMLPPTPRQTPRSTTPVYRSGDESDRSHHSSGSAAGRRRASAVYVNGQKVMDLGSGHRKRDSRTERIVIVDGPPTQRTPPQQYTMPYTAPPSPNAGVAGPFPYNIVEPLSHHRRESASGGLRPVIVDERPRPHVSIEVVNHHDRRRAQPQPQPQPPHRSAHRRHPSDDSRHSRSSSSAESDEERRARRHRERADRERAEEEVRRQKLRARIAAANAEINRRPPVPIRNRAPTAPVPHAAAPYVRPAVEVAMPGGAADRDRELVEAVRQLDISNRRLAAEKERRERERAERDEEEAQRARLKERMQPRRRATVGPGNRRHRVLYDDGIYRWE